MCIKKIKTTQKAKLVMRGLMGNGYVPKVVLEKNGTGSAENKVIP